MRSQVLVSEKKYHGKYVALSSFSNGRVMASGKAPEEVHRRAKEKGVKSPVIVFVPEKNLINIY